MSKDKKETDYPIELESQFILRLPEEPAKHLRDALKSDDSLKNRLTLKIDNDMRQGEVRFDHWLMHSKIFDLPTIVESLKTIDNKSFYKTADICQIMICKEGPEQTTTEEESPAKNKKKDAFKVDKKYLFPHGITPPTKNVRKRRFRKTLKKKYVEAPEIEKEVKRLLRADNEAVSVKWEVVKEEDDLKQEPQTSTHIKHDRKGKSGHTPKSQSNVVDIFGGAVSDSDLEEEHVNIELEDSRLTKHDKRHTDKKSKHSGKGKNTGKHKANTCAVEFNPNITRTPKHKSKASATYIPSATVTSASALSKVPSSEDDDYRQFEHPKEDMTERINQLKIEVDELKKRRVRTQKEIAGMENVALRQRFQETLHVLNQDIMYKEMEYQGLLTLQNSDDI